MTELARRIAENLAQVRGRIADAARSSGRDPAAVTLLAVTKYVPAPIAAALVAAGCPELGESRPQELWSKASELANPSIHWHLIGHLQRNKIRRTLELVHLIHSVDSLRLLSALNQQAAELGRRPAVLLEANISGDITKTGMPPEDLEPLLASAAEFSHVRICGLMGMASLEGGLSAAARDFARLRQLRDRLATICPAEVSLAELSMGMSGDFQLAIEHGATIVRIGSALFEGIPHVIALEDHPEGTILPVRAHAGARRNDIRGEQAGSLQVSVTQSPEKGKANKAIIALLAESLSLRKSQFELLSGETSQQKRILVRDISNADLTNRIAKAFAAPDDRNA